MTRSAFLGDNHGRLPAATSGEREPRRPFTKDAAKSRLMSLSIFLSERFAFG